MNGQDLYQRFHDWRVRLYERLEQVETRYLAALRGDLVQALARIDQELQRREAKR